MWVRGSGGERRREGIEERGKREREERRRGGREERGV